MASQSDGSEGDMERVVVRADSARLRVPGLQLDMQLPGGITTVQGTLLSVATLIVVLSVI